MTQEIRRSGNACSFFLPIYRASTDKGRATKGRHKFPQQRKEKQNHKELTEIRIILEEQNEE